MKRGRKKKNSPRGKSGGSSRFPSRLYLTLLIWPLLIAGLVAFQLRLRVVEVDAELQQIEQEYQREMEEVELQIELLKKQLELPPDGISE